MSPEFREKELKKSVSFSGEFVFKTKEDKT
jgi:hypothetical protein